MATLLSVSSWVGVFLGPTHGFGMTSNVPLFREFKMKKRYEARRGRVDARDAEIGKRIRALRLERGLSQTDLADSLKLTFQQVQKYEKGVNRVSATRLLEIAENLNIPIMFFYGATTRTDTPDTDSVEAGLEFMTTAGAVRLMRAYSQMNSGKRVALAKLAEEMARSFPSHNV